MITSLFYIKILLFYFSIIIVFLLPLFPTINIIGHYSVNKAAWQYVSKVTWDS